MEMSELDDAMQEHMAYLVFVQHRTFSYLDFLSFKVNDMEYSMSHGTFRNKILKLIATDKAELVCNSGFGFYSLKGIQVQKKLMTPNHMGVHSCHRCHYHQQRDSHADDYGDADAAIAPSLPSLYGLIQDLPLDKRSLHDIRLRFEIPDIHIILSSSLKVPNFQQQLQLNSDSKDISLPTWNINDLNIKVTVHRTNTVSVIVGCSYAPIATDVGGVIRLSTALSRVEERISRLLDDWQDYSR